MPRPKHSACKEKFVKELRGVRLVHNRIAHEDSSHTAGGNFRDGLSSEPLLENPTFPFRVVQAQEITFVKSDQHPLKTLWDQRPAWFRPIHCSCDGDRNLQERIANVVTSIPFIILGLQIPRKHLSSKLYGTSLCGVGIASTLYHVSSGDARKVFRYGDYAMIAASTLCLSGAVRKENSTALMVASAVLLPFSPFVVSIVHTSLMEATFAQRAKTEPALRKSHGIHTLSSVIGGGLFIADDVFPNTPYIHAAWHLAAALGVATSAALVG